MKIERLDKPIDDHKYAVIFTENEIELIRNIMGHAYGDGGFYDYIAKNIFNTLRDKGISKDGQLDKYFTEYKVRVK